jgi:hypothetical protein
MRLAPLILKSSFALLLSACAWLQPPPPPASGLADTLPAYDEECRE